MDYGLIVVLNGFPSDCSKTPEDPPEELFRSKVLHNQHNVPHGHHSPAEVMMVPSLGARSGLLRPPSVVVSDHDLCPEGGDNMTFITLDEIDAAYLQNQNMRRRLSDCSTCSSFSLSDSDFTLNLQPEDEEELDSAKKVSYIKTFQTFYSACVNNKS